MAIHGVRSHIDDLGLYTERCELVVEPFRHLDDIWAAGRLSRHTTKVNAAKVWVQQNRMVPLDGYCIRETLDELGCVGIDVVEQVCRSGHYH